MHEIGRQQQRAAAGHRPPAEELAGKPVDHRQHQHAEERAHEAPAEGRHAEEPDAETEDLLAERRMADLIGPHAAQMLPGGAGVVDLVKVAGVEEIGRVGHQGLLVAEFRDGAAEGQQLARGRDERDLAQLRAVPAGDAHRAHRIAGRIKYNKSKAGRKMASKRSKKTMSDEAIKQRWIDGQIAWHINHPEARIEHAEKHFQPYNNERHRRAEQRKSIKWYREEYKKGIKPIVKPLPDQPQEYYDELDEFFAEGL